MSPRWLRRRWISLRERRARGDLAYHRGVRAGTAYASSDDTETVVMPAEVRSGSCARLQYRAFCARLMRFFKMQYTGSRPPRKGYDS